MKMVDFDVAEYQYRIATKIDEDIARLHYPQKYVLLEAFGARYSLEIQEVTDTAFFLNLTDDAIKHYTRVEKKIMNENKELKKENKKLKQENKRLKEILKIKRKEIINRVLALQEITDKYTNEVLFKNNVNPNDAVKQVLKEILSSKVIDDG